MGCLYDFSSHVNLLMSPFARINLCTFLWLFSSMEVLSCAFLNRLQFQYSFIYPPKACDFELSTCPHSSFYVLPFIIYLLNSLLPQNIFTTTSQVQYIEFEHSEYQHACLDCPFYQCVLTLSDVPPFDLVI